MSEHDYPPIKPGEEWDAANRDEFVDTILWYQTVNRGWQRRAEKAEAERDDALERLALVRAKVSELEDAIECWRAERDELRMALRKIASSCECGCRCCKATEHMTSEALEASDE